MNRTLLAALFAISGVTVTRATTFTVINTNDSGAGSLRQAITNANGTAGTDDIVFNIPGAGQKTISITGSDLPTLTETVIINGGNGGVASNRVEITNGDNLRIDGIAVSASNCEIRNLVINGFNRQIGLFGGGNGAKIQGCRLCVNPAGNMYVGGIQGIQACCGASGALIGGTTLAERNIISGSSGGAGITLDASSVTIQGNFIGVSANGTQVVGPPQEGVSISNGSAVVGGTNPGEGNVIVGFHGVLFGGNPALGRSSGTVQGNFIGTNAAADTALNLNNGSGVAMVHAQGVLIEGNVISGNGDGVTINQSGINGNTSFNITVQGNFIGTGADGVTPLGNTRSGIDNNCPNNVIGGTGPGEGNVIAFNGQAGVHHRGSTGNPTLGNSIFSNGGLGIDLDFDGPTLNDDGDADTGANNLQNFPVITQVTRGANFTNFSGSLDAAPNTTYRLEFFANDTIDPTGYGEGQTFLVALDNIMTNANGHVGFGFQTPNTIGPNQRLTATATDPNGNTSEFSGAIGQLTNISTRMEVLTGNSVLIGGFIVGGTGSTQILLRALGPTLQNFGITGFLADPTLELHDGTGAFLMSNDNWKDTQQSAINATGKAPPNDLESAILHTFAPGNYTGIVRGKNDATGIGLIEAYDIDQSITTTLTNISTRGFVDTDQNVMIGGFIPGNGIVRVIIRALGPTLSQFGVPNVLADPTLELHDAQGTLLVSNDNWQDTQQAEIQASGFAPPDTVESAIIAVRPAGNSTAIVRGKNNTIGNALVEVYILPP